MNDVTLTWEIDTKSRLSLTMPRPMRCPIISIRVQRSKYLITLYAMLYHFATGKTEEYGTGLSLKCVKEVIQDEKRS